jgi:hypothetical protein
LSTIPITLQNWEGATKAQKEILNVFPNKYTTLIFQRPASHFLEIQQLGIWLLTKAKEKENITRQILYLHAYDLGTEQLNSEKNCEIALKRAGLYMLDILDAVPPHNQKYVGNVLLHLMQNKIPGIITTTIPSTQWKSSFDKSLNICLAQMYDTKL